MENLSISDAPPGAQQHPSGPAQAQGQAQGAGQGQQAPAQLPPQMFTTAAQLLDLTDKKLMIALRDGRKLIGVLRSWDQFANLVLQSTIERFFVPRAGAENDDALPRGYYADETHGIFLVRGENVLLLGEIDLDHDDEAPPGYEQRELAQVKKMAEERKRVDKAKEKTRLKKLARIGFEGENLGDMVM